MALKIYQALWAMTGAPVPESFDRVAAAGFDGMAIDLGALSLEAAQATVPEFRRTGLAGLVTAFPRSIEDLRPALHLAHEIGAPFTIIVGQVMPLTVAEMAETIRAWLRVAAQERMPVQFETHRNCITNDLFATLLLLDDIPEMVLSADLSHYVVDREMPCPPPPVLQAYVERILDRSGSLQGRIAARGQIQVALDFPQNRKWVDLFLSWWEYGLRRLRARGPQDDAVFLCELGPPDYAITGPDGRELSDRWVEALALRDHVRAIWDRLSG
ncbi:MAG TPA: sugar phosphate isomerase/epimerase [Acetobacteraceae bacterium]|nr:sugar phosphate isomerase/epimerase [Acetobacteraceae bacterium]